MVDYKNEHIVFILPNMDGGGTEKVVSQLANEYINKGINISIILFAGEDTAYPLDPRIKVEILGLKTGKNLFRLFKKIVNIRKYYMRNKGCTVFAFSSMGAIFTAGLSHGCNIKMLVSERSDPRSYNHPILRNWAYGKADVVAVQTEDMKYLYNAKIEQKAIVIPNWVPKDIPDPYMGEREKKIVTTGRFMPPKNHQLLVRAFAKFYVTHEDYTLNLYAKGGYEDELRILAKDLKIEDSVIFEGFKLNVKEEISNATMYILSSDYEGISNSMIEAMAMGIPTICTDCPVGGARMYIEDGVNGLLTEVGNVDMLAEKMSKIADDGDFAESLSRNAIRIRDKYEATEIMQQFLDAIFR